MDLKAILSIGRFSGAWGWPRHHSILVRYGIAVGGVLVSTSVRAAIDTNIPFDLPFITFFIGIVAAAWYGGLWPATFAVFLSALAADYWFIPPRGTIYLDSGYGFATAIFILEGLGISLLVEQLHIKRIQAEQDTARIRHSEKQLKVLAGRLEDEVQERTQDLTQSHARLRALANALNLAEHRERKRLATELHDHLQQMLVLAKIKLAKAKQVPEAKSMFAETLAELDETLKGALSYTRTLVAELSPAVLRDHGLAAGLKWLAEYMKKYELEVSVDVSDVEDSLLPEDHTVLLFQCVRELLLNCSKYADTDTALLKIERREGRLEIVVQDCGKGFSVGATENTAVDSWSKFGLFSVRERMTAIGGSFEIQSAPGLGTRCTLSVSLPESLLPAVIMPAQLPASLTKTQAKMYENGKIRVLLVDDHAMVRQGIRSLLEGYPDIEVTCEAADGEEAVQCIGRVAPHVILMDINMPRMNGIEATMRIKRQAPHISIIGLSVNAEGENADLMRQAGAASVMTKEAAVDQLHSAIRESVAPAAGSVS